MDKNSITGLILIGAIIIGFMVWNQPTKEQLARQKFQQDSIALVEKNKVTQEQIAKAQKEAITHAPSNDSIANATKQLEYGDFASALTGDDKPITIENDLIKATISPKGGRIVSVELKQYLRFNTQPLILFDKDSSTQNLTFKANSKEFSTDAFYFTPEGSSFKVNGTESKSISLRLYAGNPAKYIEYVYSLKGDEYMLDYHINIVGLQDVIASNSQEVVFNWQMKTPSQEQNHEKQQQGSTIYYKYTEGKLDNISESSDEKVTMEEPVKWVGFKQQFFTSVLISGSTPFSKNATIETKNDKLSKTYIKEYTAALPLAYTHQKVQQYDLRFYFGPNHYQTLKKYDIGLEGQIKLGWRVFGWLNRFLVIPIFNFLAGFNLNYGIIILILTVILKLLLLPIAYRTVLSSAKMRVLKPEIDELNEKYKNEDPLKKQQATMALYKQAGVNPMAGCIPVLLQMPILFALLNFFPASIELRQQGFLWAHDLSTYDSVYDFGFSVPWYGDHVSLFALLMTGSTLLYTWSNSQLMGTNNQMPGMKWMMYLMPIIFLGFLNNYSAGLSWYYFLANMITFLQTWVMQKFVINHEALHAKIQENKKKPAKVSKFQQRLEQMTKERQQQLNQKKKNP
ncbi:MAG TPA: membrane protein insertase YidC [Bacteroidia bacterium]|nr:membrane protein insertase YidC [Bacteroidia bacterium]